MFKAAFVSLLIAGLALPGVAHAQRWFEIEVLMFKRNVDPDKTAESWPDQTHLETSGKGKEVFSRWLTPIKTNETEFICDETTNTCSEQSVAVSIEAPSAVPVVIKGENFSSGRSDFVIQSSNRLKMNAKRKRLEQHAAYTPLLHMAWKMPVSSKRRSVPIHLFSGKNYQHKFNIDGGLNTDGNSPEPVWQLDGLLNIYLQHYLYIKGDFQLRREGLMAVLQPGTTEMSAEIADTEQPVVLGNLQPVDTERKQLEPHLYSYPFQQYRRVRSGEIHYFDHPLMGMLVQIRKL